MVDMSNANIQVTINIKSEFKYEGVITQEEDGKFWAINKTFGPFDTFYAAGQYLQDSVGLDMVIHQSQNKDGGDKKVFVTVEDPRKFNFYIDGQIETRDFDIVRDWDQETEEPEYRAVHYSRVGWWQPAGPRPNESPAQTDEAWENMRRRVEAQEQAKYGRKSSIMLDAADGDVSHLRDNSEYVGRWTEAAGETVGNGGEQGKDDEYEKYIRHDARNRIYYIDGLDKLINGAKGYHTKDEALEDIKGFIEGRRDREAEDREKKELTPSAIPPETAVRVVEAALDFVRGCGYHGMTAGDVLDCISDYINRIDSGEEVILLED